MSISVRAFCLISSVACLGRRVSSLVSPFRSIIIWPDSLLMSRGSLV